MKTLLTIVCFGLLSLTVGSVVWSAELRGDDEVSTLTWTPEDPTLEPGTSSATPPWEGCPATGWVYGQRVFQVPVQIFVQPYRITINLSNLTGGVLGCQTFMEGWTAWGRYQRGSLVLPPLYPGQNGFSTMTPIAYGDYFLNGRGAAWCQYL